MTDPKILIKQVINCLEISDHLDAEDILSVTAKLREALHLLSHQH